MSKWQRRSPEKETQEPENIGTEAFPSSVVARFFTAGKFLFLFVCGCKLLIYDSEAKQSCDSFPCGRCVDNANQTNDLEFAG